ncbi:signal peptidase II [Bifidobacterium apicola]|uniref:signal peptidase II n=1 Tax=Bifidobacterium apicola TaxID=3230739 RepID=UPI0036F42080
MTKKTQKGRLRGRVAVFVALAAVAIALDQVTKALALARLGNGVRVALPGPLRGLRLVRNPGASLGLGSGSTWVISLIALAACVLIIVLALRTTSMVWILVLSLAFSGAAGNLIDRVTYASGFLDGAVVDFLDYGWSVGNVADVYLTLAGVAVVVLIVCNVRFSDRCQPKEYGGEAK